MKGQSRTALTRPFALLTVIVLATGSGWGAPKRAQHRELLFGDDTAGPFTLAWTAIVPGTESVSVDGRRLLPILDYEIEPTAGKIQFRTPLRTGQLVQAEYQYRVGTAKPNRTALQLPMSLTVVENRRSNVRVLGAFRQSAAGGAPAVLGFGADARAAGAQVRSLFLVGPASPGPGGGAPRRGGLMDSSALQFSADDAAGALKYRASLTQAGRAFAGAPQLQTPAGLRQLDLAASFQGGKALSVTAESRRTDALAASLKAKETASEKLRLAYQPSAATSLTLSQESGRKRNNALVEEETQQSRLQLDQKFGATTQFGALLERISTRTGATGDERERAAFSLQSHPLEQLTLRTRAEQSDSRRDGSSRVYEVGAELKATAALSLDTTMTRTDTEKSGARADTRFGLALRGPLAIAAGLQSVDTERGDDTLGTFWTLRTGKRRSISLEGKSFERSPSKGEEQAEESYRLEAQPHPGVKLAAVASAKSQGDRTTSEGREASLELNPAKSLTLGGSLRTVTESGVSARTTSVSGALKGSLLEIDGRYRQRERDGVDALLTHDYRVGLKPARWLRVDGRYAENPEDKEGRVQDQVATSVGVETKIGSLTLGGSVGATEARKTQYAKEQREYRLALHLSGRTRIHGSYTESDERTAALVSGRTYSFGFTRAVGRDFYLQLDGTMTRFEQDGMRLSDRDDTRANLRLGLKF